jgi:MFS family permease
VIILRYIDKSFDKYEGKVKDEHNEHENPEHQIHRKMSNPEEILIKKTSKISTLPNIFWKLSLMTVSLYGAFMPFTYIASGFFIATSLSNLPKSQAHALAGAYISIPYFISCFFIPLFGYMIDKHGKRAYLAVISSLTGILSYILFLFMSPILPLILLGITYSLFASVIWPCVPLLVKPNLVGYSFGLISSMQNLSLVLIPIIFAGIYDISKNYYVSISFFLFIMSIAFVCSIFLVFEDKKNESVLHKSKNDANISIRQTQLISKSNDRTFNDRISKSCIISPRSNLSYVTDTTDYEERGIELNINNVN